jgi:hypothetical protein
MVVVEGIWRKTKYFNDFRQVYGPEGCFSMSGVRAVWSPFSRCGKFSTQSKRLQ